MILWYNSSLEIPMKKIAILIAAILWTCARPLYAIDVLDVFKFHRDTEVKLQDNVSLYDPVQSHGVVSPFTAYIGQMVSRLASVKALADIPEIETPPLNPGEIIVEYVDPKKYAGIQDEVIRRNYVGVREFFVVNRNIEDVFRMATDYDHLALLLPGMEQSKIIDRRANRVDVENWRKTDASIFGKRKSYYLTANIFWPSEDPNKRIIKSQLLRGEKKKSKYQLSLYMDCIWYFESCGEQCTKIFYIGFSLLRLDYQRTPPFFPFISREVRKQVVEGVVEGGTRSSLAAIVKWGNPRFRDRPIASFSPDDKKAIAEEVETRLKKLKEEGRIRIDWDKVFD